MNARNPEAKIAAITQAAAELAVQSGPDSLTHRAVAAAAGVAVGTTTKYFSSITDLRTAALSYLADEINTDLASIRTQLSHCTTQEQRISALAQLTHEWLTDERSVYRECALITHGVFNPDLRNINQRWYTGFGEALCPHFTDAQITALSQLLDGATIHAALTNTVPSLEEIHGTIRALSSL